MHKINFPSGKENTVLIWVFGILDTVLSSVVVSINIGVVILAHLKGSSGARLN